MESTSITNRLNYHDDDNDDVNGDDGGQTVYKSPQLITTWHLLTP